MPAPYRLHNARPKRSRIRLFSSQRARARRTHTYAFETSRLIGEQRPALVIFMSSLTATFTDRLANELFSVVILECYMFCCRLRNENNALRLPTDTNGGHPPTRRRRRRLRSSEEIELNPSSFPKKRPVIKKKGQPRDVPGVSSSSESLSDDE